MSTWPTASAGVISSIKSAAVNKWLDGAAELADDLVKPGSPAARGETASQRAGAGRPGRADRSSGRLEVGERRDGAGQNALRPNLRSDSGQADSMAAWAWRLCDAVQIEQTRHQYDRALALRQAGGRASQACRLGGPPVARSRFLARPTLLPARGDPCHWPSRSRRGAGLVWTGRQAARNACAAKSRHRRGPSGRDVRQHRRLLLGDRSTGRSRCGSPGKA